MVDGLFSKDFPRHPIGRVATRVRRPLRVESEAVYSLLGVRWYGGGCFLRERRHGADLSAEVLYQVEEGDFIYNRLFGWKGSFAVVGPEHDGAAVSAEFPTYRGNDQELLTEYLGVVCSAPGFMDMAYGRSRGATATSRNRLKESEFEQIEIPVPPLPIQSEIVDVASKLRAYRKLSQRRDALAEALESSMLSAALTGQF